MIISAQQNLVIPSILANFKILKYRYHEKISVMPNTAPYVYHNLCSG